jgi:hypothetical protein
MRLNCIYLKSPFFYSLSLLLAMVVEFSASSWAAYDFIPPRVFEGLYQYQSFRTQVGRNRPELLQNLLAALRAQPNASIRSQADIVFNDFIVRCRVAGAVEISKSDIELLGHLMTDEELSEQALARHLSNVPGHVQAGGFQANVQPAIREPSQQLGDLPLPTQFTDTQGVHVITSNPNRQVGRYGDDNRELSGIHGELKRSLEDWSRDQIRRTTGQVDVAFANDLFQNGITPEDPYRINSVQVTIGDPYLSLHQVDLEAAISRAETTDARILTRIRSLVEAGMAENDHLSALRVGQQIENQQQLEQALGYMVGVSSLYHPLSYPHGDDLAERRRFVRLADTVMSRQDPEQLGSLAIALANPYIESRCIDGIRSVLSDSEVNILGAQNALTTTQHLGDLVSRILAGLKRDFYQEMLVLSNLGSGGIEVRTDMGIEIRNRLVRSIGLEGEVHPAHYSFLNHPWSDLFSEDRLLRLWITGGSGTRSYQNAGYQAVAHEFSIPKLTPRLLVEKMIESRRLDWRRPSRPGVPGQFVYPHAASALKMTPELISREAQADPLVYNHYLEFCEQLGRRNTLRAEITRLKIESMTQNLDHSTAIQLKLGEFHEAERLLASNPFFERAPHRVLFRDSASNGSGNGSSSRSDEALSAVSIPVSETAFSIRPEFALYILTKYNYVLTE